METTETTETTPAPVRLNRQQALDLATQRADVDPPTSGHPIHIVGYTWSADSTATEYRVISGGSTDVTVFPANFRAIAIVLRGGRMICFDG